MAIEILVPRLGWSMDEGTLTQWLKQDGEYVRKGEMLFVLEGDKAAQEIECFDQGILRILPTGPRPGDSVQVGQLLGYLVAEGETAPFQSESHSPASAATKSISTTSTTSDHGTEQGKSPFSSSTARRGKTRATPRARRLAAEAGLNWRQLGGSGSGGRIRERDVLADLSRSRSSSQTAESDSASEDATAISPTRRTIAERMVASLHATAPVTLTTTADATKLLQLRQKFVTSAVEKQSAPTLTDLIVKVTAVTLRAFPLLNARWEDDELVTSRDIHIGIAVDTDSGLLVPVVQRVQELSIESLAAQSRDLIEKARARRLQAHEMQGGTFTVTNLGPYGIDAFTPIIQTPQCAILGVGRIRKVPVFFNNQWEARDQITLSLTFDHRIVDGAPAARFLQALVRALEAAAV